MNSPSRLYFIDAIRAFAICMMLQGHFIDGLLSNTYRNTSNIFFNIWLYFRGITAPVFFAVSGFIFMFLLLKEEKKDPENAFHSRVMKGIRRGIMLIFVGYILRINPWGLLAGKIYPNTYLIDVLHCIGLSLLFLISIYLFSYHRKRWILPAILLTFCWVIFFFSPMYKSISYAHLPVWIANYFSKENGSVFTIFPWFGYTCFGAFISYFFYKYQHNDKLYSYSIILGVTFGILLSFFSECFFEKIYLATNFKLFHQLAFTDNIFTRLGNVILVFVFFISLRKLLTNNILLKIGQNTLSIYIIHYIILYGSFTGIGLYGIFHHTLPPITVIFGAIIFLICTLILSFLHDKHQLIIKNSIKKGIIYIKNKFIVSNFNIFTLW